MLKEMQTNLFERAKKYRDANSFEVNSLRRIQEEDRGAGGFLLGALGRHARDGGPHRRRDEGDDPLHSVQSPEGNGQVHGDGQAVGGAGGVCAGVLTISQETRLQFAAPRET